MKPKQCKVCATEFIPRSLMQQTCDWRCALEHVAMKREKAERKELKEKKKALKTKSDYAREAQAAFNRYIRKRDEHLPCISCGRMHPGQWHAGHYRTTAAAPQLRYTESNCHKQCAPCNSHKSGDIVNYRMALIERIGEKAVEELERNNESKKWTVEELIEIKKAYNKKYRELL